MIMTKNLHKKIALQVYASGEDDLFDKDCERGGTCYEDAGQFILRKASPSGFDSKVWEDTKARVLERTRREFVWLGWGHADWGTPIEREALQELSYEGKVEFHIGKGYIATDSFLARNAKSDIPKTVKRYVEEHLAQGNDEGKAYALAWSRFCKYKYPNSPHCKKDEYFEGRKSSSRLGRIAKKISEEAARKLVEEYSEELADMEREITIRFKKHENGNNTEVEVEDSEGESFTIGPIPVSLATFAREMDYWSAPEDQVTDIERHITEMEGKEYKEAASRVASRYYKQAINMDYFNQRREVPWKFMEEDPYDHAIMALRTPLARWTEFPSRSLKDEIIDIWTNLHPELKEALDEANKKAMGSSTTIMWRVENSGNFPTDFGGYSMHDSLERGRVKDFIRNLYDVKRGEPLSQAEYKDPSEWELKDTIQGYKVKADDVLIHYGIPRNPLGDGRWSFEKEIILKPGAQPKPLSEKEILKNLSLYL